MLDPSHRPTPLPPWLQSVYKFQTSAVAVGAERMSYAVEGQVDAPPLLLIHGNLTWSLLWRNVIPEASKRFRVIAPDHVGFGLSSKPRSEGYHTLKQHIENLTTLAQSLSLEKMTIAAVGWGGPIALGYATRFPENVARILLMNTWVWPWSTVRRTWRGRLLEVLCKMGGDWALRQGLNMLATQPLDRAVTEGLAYPFGGGQSRAALRAFAQMQARDASTLEKIGVKLSSVRARIEILWGARDPRLPGKVLPFLLRDSFANVGEPKLLSEASHLVPEDDPAAVVEKLLEVLKPKPAAPVFNILR